MYKNIKFQSTFTDTIFISYYKQYKILLGKNYMYGQDLLIVLQYGLKNVHQNWLEKCTSNNFYVEVVPHPGSPVD